MVSVMAEAQYKVTAQGQEVKDCHGHRSDG